MKELLKKIQQVSEAVKSIEKDMTVGTGKSSYKAVSDLMVVLKVKEAEKNAGIISIPVKQELIRSEIVKTMKKEYNSNEMVEKIMYEDTVKMTVKIYDLESGESLEIESFGRGLDQGDKGFGKASTYARKYALLNAYKIATGEDPDANKSEEQEIISTNDKKTAIINYMENDIEYTQKVIEHFKIDSTDDLTDKDINMIYQKLKKSGKI